MHKILKFGGTSMGSKESVTRVIRVLERYSEDLVVVVSAMSGVTDLLLDMALAIKQGQDLEDSKLDSKFQKIFSMHQNVLQEYDLENQLDLGQGMEILFQELKDALTNPIFIAEINLERYLDYISSFGERLSASMLSLILNSKAIESNYLDARQILVTDSSFQRANLEHALSAQKTQDYFAQNKSKVTVVTGFIARSLEGATTTLGRGGSDYTAALIANYLSAKEVEIWTDVSGVFSTDPRITDQARVVQSLSFSEAFEVAYYGGKVLYPKTMEACLPKNITIKVKNTFEPEQIGTSVSNHQSQGIKVVSRSKNNYLVEVQLAAVTSEIGLLGKIFSWFAIEKINIDVVSTSGDSVSFTCDQKPSQALLDKVSSQIGMTRTWSNQEVVAVIGTEILSHPKYPEIIQIISKNNPKTIVMNTKQTNLSAIVEEGAGENLVRTLHAIIYE